MASVELEASTESGCAALIRCVASDGTRWVAAAILGDFHCAATGADVPARESEPLELSVEGFDIVVDA